MSKKQAYGGQRWAREQSLLILSYVAPVGLRSIGCLPMLSQSLSLGLCQGCLAAAQSHFYLVAAQ